MNIQAGADELREKVALTHFAGIIFGEMVGGITGPIVFNNIGLNDPAAAAVGALSGAACGYALTAAVLFVRRDTYVAEQLLNALTARKIPLERVHISVKNGRVMLHGEVNYDFEKEEIEHAVGALSGIKGITNHIRARISTPPVPPEEVRREIEEAFTRSAQLDARSITVHVDGSRVTLEGAVHSRAEAAEAERAVRTAPGVVEVINGLRILPEPVLRR
jgi:osmotically-inducible protein OsmY